MLFPVSDFSTWITEGSNEDDMGKLFYHGLSPWIHTLGYKWSRTDDVIAGKFIKLCHTILVASSHGYNCRILAPTPQHRNLPEDRDTFEYYVNSIVFLDFIKDWEHYDSVIGTRFDNILREFCYCWLDVASGKPGIMTQALLNSNETTSDDDGLPTDPYTRKTKYELY